MRRSLTLVLLLALTVTSLFLASDPSSAQPAADEPTCPTGSTPIGDQCAIDDGPLCPTDFNYLIDDECERFAEPLTELVCPENATPLPTTDECIEVSNDRPPRCPDGTAPATGEFEGECFEDFGPAAEPQCPDGYSRDDSLGGMCARFENAVQGPEFCPDGARGEVDGCHIFVARGPFRCLVGERQLGNECLVVGPAPVRDEGVCPTAADVVSDDGCYRLVEATAEGVCPEGSTRTPADGEPFECRQPVDLIPGALQCIDGFGLVDGECLGPIADVGPFPCIAEQGRRLIQRGDLCVVVGDAPIRGAGICPTGNDILPGCYRLVSPVDGECPAAAEPVPNDEGQIECRVAVPLLPGPLDCARGFGLVGGECWIAADLTITAGTALCPSGSYEDLTGNCRKPVANARGTYSCPDPDAALNGRSCVYTAPFEIEPCEQGVRIDDRCALIAAPVPTVDCSSVLDPIPPDVTCYAVAPISLPTCPDLTDYLGARTCAGMQPTNCDPALAVDDRCVRLVDPITPGQMSGTVRSLDTGDPIFAIQICAQNAFFDINECTYTRGDGTFTLTGLSPQNYQVIATDFLNRFDNGCFGMKSCSNPAIVGLGAQASLTNMAIWLDSFGPSAIPTPTATVTPVPTGPTPTPTGPTATITPTPIPTGPTPTITATVTPVPTGPTPTVTSTPQPMGPTPTITPTPIPTGPTPTITATVTPVPTGPTPAPTPEDVSATLPYVVGTVTEDGVGQGVEVCAVPVVRFFSSACVMADSSGAFVLDALPIGNYWIVADEGRGCAARNSSSCDDKQMFGIASDVGIAGLQIELGAPPAAN